MLKDSLANGHEDASRGGSWPMGRGWQIPPTYAAGPGGLKLKMDSLATPKVARSWVLPALRVPAWGVGGT